MPDQNILNSNLPSDNAPSETGSMQSPAEDRYNVTQELLGEFMATTKKYNYTLSDGDLLKKFPEFNGNAKKLSLFKEYDATFNSGKYSKVEEVNTKFPEFDFSGDGAPKSKAGLGKVVGGTPNLVNKKKPVVNNKSVANNGYSVVVTEPRPDFNADPKLVAKSFVEKAKKNKKEYREIVVVNNTIKSQYTVLLDKDIRAYVGKGASEADIAKVKKEVQDLFKIVDGKTSVELNQVATSLATINNKIVEKTSGVEVKVTTQEPSKKREENETILLKGPPVRPGFMNASYADFKKLFNDGVTEEEIRFAWEETKNNKNLYGDVFASAIVNGDKKFNEGFQSQFKDRFIALQLELAGQDHEILESRGVIGNLDKISKITTKVALLDKSINAAGLDLEKNNKIEGLHVKGEGGVYYSVSKDKEEAYNNLSAQLRSLKDKLSLTNTDVLNSEADELNKEQDELVKMGEAVKSGKVPDDYIARYQVRFNNWKDRVNRFNDDNKDYFEASAQYSKILKDAENLTVRDDSYAKQIGGQSSRIENYNKLIEQRDNMVSEINVLKSTISKEDIIVIESLSKAHDYYSRYNDLSMFPVLNAVESRQADLDQRALSGTLTLMEEIGMKTSEFLKSAAIGFGRTSLNTISGAAEWISDNVKAIAALGDKTLDDIKLPATEKLLRVMADGFDYNPRTNISPNLIGDSRWFASSGKMYKARFEDMGYSTYQEAGNSLGLMLNLAVTGRIMAGGMVPIKGVGMIGRAKDFAKNGAHMFLASYSDNKNLATHLGYSGASAIAAANTFSLLESLSEQILPDRNLFNNKFKKGAMDSYIKTYIKNGAANAVANLIVNITKEFGEELGVALGQWMYTAATARAGVGNQVEELTIAESKHILKVTAMASFLPMSLSSYGNYKSVNRNAIYDMATNPDDFFPALEGLYASGKLTMGQYDDLKIEVNLKRNLMGNIPQGLSRHKSAAVLELYAERFKIESEMRDGTGSQEEKEIFLNSYDQIKQQIDEIIKDKDFDAKAEKDLQNEMSQMSLEQVENQINEMASSPGFVYMSSKVLDIISSGKALPSSMLENLRDMIESQLEEIGGISDGSKSSGRADISESDMLSIHKKTLISLLNQVESYDNISIGSIDDINAIVEDAKAELESEDGDKARALNDLSMAASMLDDVPENTQEESDVQTVEPMSLGTLENGQEITMNGKAGFVEKTDSGWFFNSEDGSSVQIPTQDKTNPTEKLSDLGITITSKSGTISVDGRSYEVSVANGEATVLEVKSDGAKVDRFSNHKDKNYAKDKKKSIVNKFLKDNNLSESDVGIKAEEKVSPEEKKKLGRPKNTRLIDLLRESIDELTNKHSNEQDTDSQAGGSIPGDEAKIPTRANKKDGGTALDRIVSGGGTARVRVGGKSVEGRIEIKNPNSKSRRIVLRGSDGTVTDLGTERTFTRSSTISKFTPGPGGTIASVDFTTERGHVVTLEGPEAGKMAIEILENSISGKDIPSLLFEEVWEKIVSASEAKVKESKEKVKKDNSKKIAEQEKKAKAKAKEERRKAFEIAKKAGGPTISTQEVEVADEKQEDTKKEESPVRTKEGERLQKEKNKRIGDIELSRERDLKIATQRPTVEQRKGKTIVQLKAETDAKVAEVNKKYDDMIAKEEAALPAVVKSSQKVYDSNNTDTSDIVTTNPWQKKVLEAVPKMISAMAKILPNMKINIHSNDKSFSDALKASGGRYSSGAVGFYSRSTGEIHINLGAIDTRDGLRTMFHEIMHPVYQSMTTEMKDVLYDTLSGMSLFGKDIFLKTSSKFKDWAVKNYKQKGDAKVREEFVVEFMAHWISGDAVLSFDGIKKIIEAFKKIFEAMGLGEFAPKNSSEAKAFAKGLVESFRSGEAIDLGDTIDLVTDGGIDERVTALDSKTHTRKGRDGGLVDGTSLKVTGKESIKAGETTATVHYKPSKEQAEKGAISRYSETFGLDDIKSSDFSYNSAIITKAQELASGEAKFSYEETDSDGIKTGKKIKGALPLPYKDSKLAKKIVKKREEIKYIKINEPLLEGETKASREARIKVKVGIISAELKKDTITIYDNFIGVMTKNLSALFDTLTPEFITEAKKWYEGANRVANHISIKYNKTLEQSAAIMALLSPQKDWFNNLSAAERVMHILTEHSDKPFTKELLDNAIAYNRKDGKEDSAWMNELKKLFENTNGMSISDMQKAGSPILAQADLLRVLDHFYNSPNVLETAPDGRIDGYGESTIMWNSPSEIGRAIEVFRDADQSNIDYILGAGNKVRNFYNNIIDPLSKNGYLTADTHAFGAALGIPMNSKIASAFGLFKSGESPLYASVKEAYQIVAKKYDMLPRELQSIIWEAFRTGVNDKNRSATQKQKAFDILIEGVKNGIDPYITTQTIINENRSKNSKWVSERGINVQKSVFPVLEAKGPDAKQGISKKDSMVGSERGDNGGGSPRVVSRSSREGVDLRISEEGVPFIKKIFDKIRSITKLNKVQHNRLFNIDTKLSKEIADAYEKMKHDPNNPKVKKAYKAMVEETKQQYNALVDGGLKPERWTGEGEPYANSKEMLNDLKENNHLWFLPNESAFGDKDAATKYKDNIGLQDSGITLDGKTITNSEVFRIVHDAIHGINGDQFGAIGEENAILQHLSMYSDEALPAVVAQTRGQNSWVNFSGVNDSANAKFKEAAKLEKEGKYDEAKKIRKEAQKEFAFAEPKIGLLPNKYNFRYYGTKNSELASKKRTNSRSGDANTGESKSPSSFGYEKNVARESESFSSRSNSEGRKIRTIYGDIIPKAIHTVKQSLVDGIKKTYPKATVDKELFEVDADIFHKAVTKAKSVNEFGAAVDVLSQKEYTKYRLFITEDGLTGIALSPDGDLGSGFDMSGKPRRLPQLLVLGIENGATHANAYHTILPNYYTAFGFKPVARNLWNDSLKPEDWSYETFKDFNNGKPDVVHFVWDGGDRNTIHERIGQFDNYNDYHKEQTPVIDTWEEAEEIVQQSLKETTIAGSVGVVDVKSTTKALRDAVKNDYTVMYGLNNKTHDVKLSDIEKKSRDTSQTVDAAINNINNGLKSKSSGTPLLIQNNDGSFSIGDGFHRVAQAIMDGKETIKADVVYENEMQAAKAYHKYKSEGVENDFTKAVEQSLKEKQVLGTEGAAEAAPITSKSQVGEDKSDTFFTAESGNKFVNKDGSPIVVYHNTKKDKITKSEGMEGKIGGTFFTPNKEVYSDLGGNKHTAIIRLTNPYFSSSPVHTRIEKLNKIKADGHDGVIVNYGLVELLDGSNNASEINLEKSQEIIVFDDSNIKHLSTIDNKTGVETRAPKGTPFSDEEISEQSLKETTKAGSVGVGREVIGKYKVTIAFKSKFGGLSYKAYEFNNKAHFDNWFKKNGSKFDISEIYEPNPESDVDMRIGNPKRRKMMTKRRIDASLSGINNSQSFRTAIANNPLAFYNANNYANIRANLSTMTDAELVEQIDTNNTAQLQRIFSNSSEGPIVGLAFIEYIKRMEDQLNAAKAANDLQEVARLEFEIDAEYTKVSMFSTKIAQILRQFGEIKGRSTTMNEAELYMKMLDKMMEARGVMITAAQRELVVNTIEDAIIARRAYKAEYLRVLNDPNSVIDDVTVGVQSAYLNMLHANLFLDMQVRSLMRIRWDEFLGALIKGNLVSIRTVMLGLYSNTLSMGIKAIESIIMRTMSTVAVAMHKAGINVFGLEKNSMFNTARGTMKGITSPLRLIKSVIDVITDIITSRSLNPITRSSFANQVYNTLVYGSTLSDTDAKQMNEHGFSPITKLKESVSGRRGGSLSRITSVRGVELEVQKSFKRIKIKEWIVANRSINGSVDEYYSSLTGDEKRALQDEFMADEGARLMGVGERVRSFGNAVLSFNAEANFRLIALSDIVPKNMATRMEMNRIANNLGLNPVLAALFVKDPLEFATQRPYEMSKEMVEWYMETISEITSTKDTGTGKVSMAIVNSVKNSLTKANIHVNSNNKLLSLASQSTNLITDMIIPFVRIPINMLSFATDFLVPMKSFLKFSFFLNQARLNQGEPMGEFFALSSIKYLSRFVIGMGMQQMMYNLMIVPGMVLIGKPGGDDDDDRKEKSRLPRNSINATALKRYLNLEDPSYQEGDEYESLNSYGILGLMAYSLKSQGEANRISEEKALNSFAVSEDPTEKIKNKMNRFGEMASGSFSYMTMVNSLASSQYFVDQSWFVGVSSVVQAATSHDENGTKKLVSTIAGTAMATFWGFSSNSQIISNIYRESTGKNLPDKYLFDVRDQELEGYPLTGKMPNWMVAQAMDKNELIHQWLVDNPYDTEYIVPGLFGDVIDATPGNDNRLSHILENQASSLRTVRGSATEMERYYMSARQTGDLLDFGRSGYKATLKSPSIPKKLDVGIAASEIGGEDRVFDSDPDKKKALIPAKEWNDITIRLGVVHGKMVELLTSDIIKRAKLAGISPDDILNRNLVKGKKDLADGFRMELGVAISEANNLVKSYVDIKGFINNDFILRLIDMNSMADVDLSMIYPESNIFISKYNPESPISMISEINPVSVPEDIANMVMDLRKEYIKLYVRSYLKIKEREPVYQELEKKIREQRNN